jgi:hypothetical protein
VVVWGHPRRRGGRARFDPLAAAVRLVATDVPGEVTVGAGRELEVRDRAEVLLRLLWHRADTSTLNPQVAELLSGALAP